MSWSTSSRERAKLGRLDSEPPLLLREWPPETGRERQGGARRQTEGEKGSRGAGGHNKQREGEAERKGRNREKNLPI